MTATRDPTRNARRYEMSPDKIAAAESAARACDQALVLTAEATGLLEQAARRAKTAQQPKWAADIADATTRLDALSNAVSGRTQMARGALKLKKPDR